MNEDIMESLFPGTKAAVAAGKCPLCGSLRADFRDALSLRERRISGLCQACQDDTFAPDEDECLDCGSPTCCGDGTCQLPSGDWDEVLT